MAYNPKNSFVNFHIEGAEALEQALRDLGNDKAIRETMKRAAVQALEPIAKDARARVRANSSRTGRLAEGIDVKTQLSQRQKASRHRAGLGPLETEAFVGAAPKGPAVLIEFGTTKRHWKTGKNTGSVAAEPFMRPAWEAGKMAALDLFTKLLWFEIEKTAKRLARKTEKYRSKR